MTQVAVKKDALVAESPQPRRALGLWATMALVIGNMIGSGIFLLPAAFASFGGISIVGWVFTAAGALFLALLFARLASMVSRVGGSYAYTRLGFGDFAGFWIAWGYWISVWTGNAAIAVALVSYVSYLQGIFPVLEHQLPAHYARRYKPARSWPHPRHDTATRSPRAAQTTYYKLSATSSCLSVTTS